MPRKKKLPQTAVEESVRDSMFSAFATDGAAAMNGPDPDPKPETPETPDVTTATLLERIGELNARVEMLAEANTRILSQPPTDTYVPPSTPKEKELPDPTLYPVEYAATLRENITASIRAENEALARASAKQRETSNQYDQLFEDFSEVYPDLATDPRRVEFAAVEVANRLKKRGMDVNRYMFGNTAKYFKDIEAEYKKIFGKDEGDDEAEETSDGRSASIFGGGEGTGRGKRAPAQNAGDMIKDIHEMQRKMGIF